MGTSNVSICNTQFEKSSTTFNGKPTWVNTGQNLTIKWDTTNDWWYIEGWSPGQQILSGNTIAPVGEWIPLDDADYFYESSPNACTDCLSSVICLTNGTLQIEFDLSSDLINGRSTWTSTSGYTIQWNSINEYWFVNGWNLGGQIRNETNTNNPVGQWVQQGIPIPVFWTASDEECPSVQLSVQISVNNVACQGSCNGTVVVTPTNGVGPYIYSIDNGHTYQNSNIINGLCEGSGEVIVRDANGNEITIPYVISYNTQLTTYTLNILQFETTLINQTNFKKKKYTYSIVANPTLPVNSSLTFTINGTNVDLLKQPGNATFTHTWNRIVNGISTPIPPQPSSPSIATSTRSCASGNQTQTTSTWNYINSLLTLNSQTPFIQIECITEIQITSNSSDSSCPTYAETNTSLILSTAKLNNLTCSSLQVPVTLTNSYNLFIQGTINTTSRPWAVMILNTPCASGNCGTFSPNFSNQIFTNTNVNSLNAGVVVYSDSSLTNYIPINTYFQYNNIVYAVGNNGIVYVYCDVDLGC
jgi:hypothetical protein